MTTTWRHRRKVLTAASWGSALTAVFALIGLIVITGAPGNAGLSLRAHDYNQMTGVGSTSSAVTVNWTSGLLNAENQPITGSSSTDGGAELSPNSDRSAASPTSPLSFMYSDFKKISVTVSQTQDIGHQGITVSWSGANPPPTVNPDANFMQMMECYGDSDSGPSPEGCMYGSSHMLAASTTNGTIGQRGGRLCDSGAPGSTLPSTNPVDTPTGTIGDASYGCDPYEPAAETPAHCDTADGPTLDCATAGQFYAPFVPVSGGAPLYQPASLTQQFNQFNTNEVQYAPTSSDGTGQRQFQTLTAVQAPSLGCGDLESNGQTRSCWLVIVPRGTYEPNGFQVPNQDFNYQHGQSIDSSPLSASNWAQRIQIHLGYAPLATNCPITVVPDSMVGTQVAYRAVTSWQGELNQQANCSRVYSYTATTESSATNQITGGSTGLAFTTIPIGSEVTRDDPSATPPTLPTILYAPVAVTALDVGYNINQVDGQVTTPVKLTPALLARSLTQAYLADLPDYDPPALPGPAWSTGNPTDITQDPEFHTLNPEVDLIEGRGENEPFVTGDHSADNQRVWQYIQSDPATGAWLDAGAADSSDPVGADPDYTALKLGATPAPDSFPVAYTGTATCGEIAGNDCGTTPDAALNSIDMIPVQNNFDQAAATVAAGSDSALTVLWNPTTLSPQGKEGWWTPVGAQVTGHVFMSALNDMPDLAAYGLNSAALCPADANSPTDTSCIQPSLDSVAAALNSPAATTDSTGLIQVNPGTVPAGAYPLVDVVYAAVPTDQSATALNDYADFIDYASGQGQTTGSAPGDLPAGYLPLTSSLQAQAQSVVTQLRALAGGSPSASASATDSATGTGSATPTPSTSQSTGGGGTSTGGASTTSGGGSTTSGGGTSTGGGSSSTGGGTSTGGGSTTTGGGSTTTSGGSTGTGGTSATTEAATPGSQPSASSTCTAAATPTASGTPTAAGTASAPPTAAAPASTGCASSQAFDVLPPSAEAAAGTTPATVVGSIRDVLIIVLIIGAAGAVAGGFLRYGHAPGRGRRTREPTGGR